MRVRDAAGNMMAARAFIVPGRGTHGDIVDALAGLESTVLAFRCAEGPMSFLRDEDGLALLDHLLADACVVTGRGIVIPYGDGASRVPFLAAVAARSGVCFHGPDQALLDEARALAAYDQAQRKQALQAKHGRPVELPQRPILESIGTNGTAEADAIDWMLAHCEVFSVWRHVTGTETQPILFGKGRDALLAGLASLCAARSIDWVEVDSIAAVPDW